MEGDGGLLVRQELQADCLAGVWANNAQQRLNWLEPGDIEEALNAANAIGDDRLQQQGQGRVVPDCLPMVRQRNGCAGSNPDSPKAR